MGISNKDMPKAGDRIEGKYGIYTLKEKLGNGGNGTVFAVEVDGANDEIPFCKDGYVIKILTVNEIKSEEEQEKRRQRFQREVKAVHKMESLNLNIIPIIDSYMENKESSLEWYMMPRAKEYKYYGFSQSLNKLKQIKILGESIQILHQEGVFHRDIKPANLLFYNNKCCLTDFGLVWNVDEADHITGVNEAIGPVGIRPPEMEFNIEKVEGNIDFQKVDVYLFAKTVWILLTGNRNGFRGEYRRGDKALYLDNNLLKLGKTIEPLHKMMEEATVYENEKRITIDDCLEYIGQQIDIAEDRKSPDFVERLRFEEIISEAKTQISSDAVVFEKTEKIQVTLSKLEGVVELFAVDCGKDISLGKLVKIELTLDSLFEITLKKEKVFAGQKRSRRIFLNIPEVKVDGMNNVNIRTGYLQQSYVLSDKVKDIASVIKFQGDTVGLDGEYSLIFKRK